MKKHSTKQQNGASLVCISTACYTGAGWTIASASDQTQYFGQFSSLRMTRGGEVWEEKEGTGFREGLTIEQAIDLVMLDFLVFAVMHSK